MGSISNGNHSSTIVKCPTKGLCIQTHSQKSTGIYGPSFKMSAPPSIQANRTNLYAIYWTHSNSLFLTKQGDPKRTQDLYSVRNRYQSDFQPLFSGLVPAKTRRSSPTAVMSWNWGDKYSFIVSLIINTPNSKVISPN